MRRWTHMFLVQNSWIKRTVKKSMSKIETNWEYPRLFHNWNRTHGNMWATLRKRIKVCKLCEGR